MTEAIEYRLVQNQLYLKRILLLVATVAAYIFLGASVLIGGWLGVVYLCAGFGMFIVALILVLQIRAQQRCGFSRRLLTRLYGEFGDPPLDKWSQELEANNAFNDGLTAGWRDQE